MSMEKRVSFFNSSSSIKTDLKFLFAEIDYCIISYFFKEVERVLRLIGLRIFSCQVTRISINKATIILILIIFWAPLSKIPSLPDYPAPFVERH